MKWKAAFVINKRNFKTFVTSNHCFWLKYESIWYESIQNIANILLAPIHILDFLRMSKISANFNFSIQTFQLLQRWLLFIAFSCHIKEPVRSCENWSPLELERITVHSNNTAPPPPHPSLGSLVMRMGSPLASWSIATGSFACVKNSLLSGLAAVNLLWASL